MQRNTFASLALALMLVMVAVPGSAAATHDGGGEGGLSDSVDEMIKSSTALQGVYGEYERYQDWASQWTPQAVFGTADSNDAPTASEQADALREYPDGKRDALVTYANAHVTDRVNIEDHSVVKLNLESPDDTATVYSIIETNESGDVTNVTVVNETSREIDYTLDLDEYATREIVDDLNYGYEHYVTEDADPDAFAARMGGKYNSHVEVTEGDA